MDTGTFDCRRSCRDGSLIRLNMTRTQAKTLARLIRGQLDAYAESIDGPPRKRGRPFTAADLDRLEPLLAGLEA